MILFPGIFKIFKRNKDKKAQLYSIFKEYVEVSSKIKSLKDLEREVRIKQLESQVDEYYVSLKDIAELTELDALSDKLLEKIKHISEIKSDNFKFVELFVTSTDKGILLSTENNNNSDLIRIATFKKVT